MVQTMGLGPTTYRLTKSGALPTELRLHMSPLGHIVERCAGSCHFCPQPPAPKGGLSREEEMKKQGCRRPVTPSAPLMLIYFFQMLPFLVQLFAKSLNVDIGRILFLDCTLLELAAFAMARKWASPFFCSCNTSRNGRLIYAKLLCYLAHAPTALKV